MWRRLIFPLITTFFILMNVLLWRAEFGGRNDLATSIPVALIWHRMLTAPDDSALEITQAGQKIGYCRWVPNVGEEHATGRTLDEDYEPEALVQHLSGYTIDLEGNLFVGTSRMRFSVHVECGTNNTWRELTLSLNLRPNRVEIRSVAAERTIRFRFLGGDQDVDRVVTFEELRDPSKLLAEMGNPMLPALLGPLADAAGAPQRTLPAVPALEWRGRGDWIDFGHSRVRAYRLETRLLDRYRFVLFTSRIGEILRVELPGNVVLLNDALLLL